MIPILLRKNVVLPELSDQSYMLIYKTELSDLEMTARIYFYRS